MSMIRLLHFADAHIDMVRYGKYDSETGLPVRVMDFLKALDFIVDTAIKEKVDLVLFAGDAYRDRNPAPTYQREWEKRIIRLSEAGIFTVLLVGNHDRSSASGRAHTLQEFQTLKPKNILVIDKPVLLTPEDLGGLQLQLIGIPWVSKASVMASFHNEEISENTDDETDINKDIEERLTKLIEKFLDESKPDSPLVLTAHASVQGAVYGAERSVMLGSDFLLKGSLVADSRISYTALGHIHKAQDLNEEGKTPVIYPGSIERIDFGEAQDKKYCVIVSIDETDQRPEVNWIEIPGRKFVDLFVKIEKTKEINAEMIMKKILSNIPSENQIKDSICRLIIEYPHELNALIDENEINKRFENALTYNLIKRSKSEARIRLSEHSGIANMTNKQLLSEYWKLIAVSPEEKEKLDHMADSIFTEE